MRRENMSGAAQSMQNWIPTVQGAMVRRPGVSFGNTTDQKLEPPPVPPIPPGTVRPPIELVTDGEFHGWSVRRRLDNSYTGPLIEVGRDPSVAGNDNRVQIFSLTDPDENGVYWIDESQIFGAFATTGQDPATSEARLAIYTIYDQVTNPLVTHRDLAVEVDSRCCPFVFSGDFGSFAYVDVPANTTSPKFARCQMGSAIPWRGVPSICRVRNSPASLWFPDVGDLDNGGIVSVAAHDGTFHVGTGSAPITRRNTHTLYSSGFNEYLVHNEQAGANGFGNTVWAGKAFQAPGDTSQQIGGAPSTSFGTPDQYNVTSAAIKYDVFSGTEAFAYSVAQSRVAGQSVIAEGTTTANARWRHGSIRWECSS